MSKELAFSIKKSDLDIQYFRAGGPGGQNQNKRDTACRITHRASGISAESREHRTQLENKVAAFRKLSNNPMFRAWIQRRLGELVYGSPEEVVECQMATENLLVEVRESGRWVKGS